MCKLIALVVSLALFGFGFRVWQHKSSCQACLQNISVRAQLVIFNVSTQQKPILLGYNHSAWMLKETQLNLFCDHLFRTNPNLSLNVSKLPLSSELDIHTHTLAAPRVDPKLHATRRELTQDEIDVLNGIFLLIFILLVAHRFTLSSAQTVHFVPSSPRHDWILQESTCIAALRASVAS